MDQLQLFDVAPVAISFTARWEYPRGWSLAVWSHHPGKSDEATQGSSYDGLEAAELADVVSAELVRRLRLL